MMSFEQPKPSPDENQVTSAFKHINGATRHFTQADSTCNVSLGMTQGNSREIKCQGEIETEIN